MIWNNENKSERKVWWQICTFSLPAVLPGWSEFRKCCAFITRLSSCTIRFILLCMVCPERRGRERERARERRKKRKEWIQITPSTIIISLLMTGTTAMMMMMDEGHSFTNNSSLGAHWSDVFLWLSRQNANFASVHKNEEAQWTLSHRRLTDGRTEWQWYAINGEKDHGVKVPWRTKASVRIN